MEKFSHETNGYNRSEVNDFISNVIKETEGIITKVKEQNSEITRLKKEVEHYKNLATLKEQSSLATESSYEEGRKVIMDAKHNASRIVNEALIKAEKIENNTRLLQKNIKFLKRNLNMIANQQKKILEEIEILELD